MPLSSHDHSDIPDFIWLWSMTAIFAFAALFPELMSDELKASLAMALFVDVFGAIFAMAAYMQLDARVGFEIHPFKLPIVITFWLMWVIALFKFLGLDLYAALAMIPGFRCAYDVYAFVRAPYAVSNFHARRYFTIFLQMAIPLICLMLLALFWEVPDKSIRQDEQFLQCETVICKIFNPPDLFILFGLFLYPLIGWLNFKWKPEWMRWIPSPKHITD